jgi:Ca-activated chloride channel homolog
MKGSLVLRGLALALVLISPFLPSAHREGEGAAVVYVVDRSASVGAEAVRRATEFVRLAFEDRGPVRVGLVAFGAHADLLAQVGASTLPPVIAADDRWGSDLAGAVRLARAALPASGRRRIVLLTDARWTGRGPESDPVAEVRRAHDEGIVVDVVPLGEDLDENARPARVTEVHALSTRIAEGEPAAVVAQVRGAPDNVVPVLWSRDGEDIGRGLAQLDARGEGEARLDDPRAGSGVHVYRARTAPGGRLGLRAAAGAAEPSAGAAIIVEGKARAIVVTVDGTLPPVLRLALEKLHVEVRVTTLDDVPNGAELGGFDMVVLADVPLAGGSGGPGIGSKAQEAMIEYARQGGGVVVIGGAFGFAPEYARAPIARLLPVEIEDRGQVEDPQVALAIMLDRSGSMSQMTGAHTKMALAVEGALAAASTLRPDDLVAIGSVDTSTHWDQPLGPLARLEPRLAAIRSITANGGGIYCYTALADAYASLRHARAPIRHVVLLADTGDAEEQIQGCERADESAACSGRPSAQRLARTARAAGITTSVVGIGSDADSDAPFLRQLAAVGNGRYYVTTDGTDLRRIFVSETRVAARSNLHSAATHIVAASAHPVLSGVDVGRMPPLVGFVEAKRRPTADTALMTAEDGRPILATWRYGLGKIVALTTDLRDFWPRGWARVKDAGKVLQQSLRYALRTRSGSQADMRVAVREGRAEVTIDLPDESDAQGQTLTLEAFDLSPDGVMQGEPMSVEREAPDRWRARGPTHGAPLLLVRARDAAGGLVGEAVAQVDGADELAGDGVDTRAARDLAHVGGGMFDPDPSLTLRREGPRGVEPIPSWPWALVAAAVLVTVDLWARRFERRRPGWTGVLGRDLRNVAA